MMMAKMDIKIATTDTVSTQVSAVVQPSPYVAADAAGIELCALASDEGEAALLEVVCAASLLFTIWVMECGVSEFGAPVHSTMVPS